MSLYENRGDSKRDRKSVEEVLERVKIDLKALDSKDA